MVMRYSLMALLAAASCHCENSQSGPDRAHPLQGTVPRDRVLQAQVRQGHVVYALRGGQAGSVTLTFDEWGQRQRVDVDASVSQPGGNPRLISLSFIRRGNTVTAWKGSSGERAPLEYAPFGIFGELQRGNLQIVSDAHLDHPDAARTGTERVLGFACETWQLPSDGPLVCMHNGLMLRSTQRVRDREMQMVATKAFFGRPIPSASFEVPDNVELIELDVQEISRRRGHP